MSKFRILALLLVLMLVIAGCGSDGNPEEDDAGTAPTQSVQSTPAGDAATDAAARTIEHALGSTEVSGTPARVVALEWPYVEALLAIGVQPVGVADVEGYTRLVNTEPSLSDDVTDVGTRAEPSLESIIALEPDLIIGVQFRHEALYDTLSDIAPTVMFNPYAEDGEQLQRMEETVLAIADAVNKPDAGVAALEVLHDKIDSAAEQLEASDVTGAPFVLSQTLIGDTAQIRLFHENATAVQILEAIGLENVWEAGVEDLGFSTVGLEVLPGVEQANFFYVPSEDITAVSFEGNPVWDGLAFVEEDRTYNLAGAWLLAGPLSGQVFIDLAVEALTREAMATGETPASDSGPRSIEHALGTTEIDGTPQTIVVLEWTYAEDLLALGIQPDGVADVEGYRAYLNIQPELADDVVDVGTRQEPSLEAITALEPDLIIGVQFRREAIYDTLSSIAPTLLFNPYPEDQTITQFDEMETTFMTIADAVSRVDEGTAVLEEMQAAFDEASAELEAAGQGEQEFLLVQAFTAQESPQMRVFIDSSMAVQILQAIGLENAWEGEFDVYGFNTVGIEALTEVDDANFLYMVQAEDDVFANQWQDNPVWNGLAFVEEGRTYPLGGDTWPFGGPLSAALLANTVVAALTE
ncbi:hypothetical protein BH24CHL1_BH24CHL1_00610 [soil metagenome]